MRTLADRELESPMPSSITRAGGMPNYYQTLNERMEAAAADNLPVGIMSGKFYLRRTKSLFQLLISSILLGRSRVGLPHAQQHHKGGRDAKLLQDLE